MHDDTLLSPEQVASLQEPHVILDTRTPESYAQGHLPGAVNAREIFTVSQPSTPEGLAALAHQFSALFGGAGLTGRERAIVYEDALDTGNGQSSRGWFLLKYLGYPRASVLHGGYKAWLSRGLPVTTAVSQPRSGRFPTAVNDQVMATKKDIESSLGDPKIVLLDVRDEPEWREESAAPSGTPAHLRPGRIPGAVWINWRRFLTAEDGLAVFRSQEEVRALCREVGISDASNVYVYCFKGSRASSTFVALARAGIKNVRNYFASWEEWGRRADTPAGNLPGGVTAKL